jgi:hypothetical protein
MKQEMFDNELLNLLSVYSLLKWLELPAEARVFNNMPPEPEVEDGDRQTEEDEVKLSFTTNKFFCFPGDLPRSFPSTALQ